MMLKHWFWAAAAAVTMSFVAPSADAGGISSATGDIKSAFGHASSVQEAAYRRCWRRHGKRHCRWYADAERNSGYYEHNADKLPFGSQRWWDQMLRENRAGNPGGGGRN